MGQLKPLKEQNVLNNFLNNGDVSNGRNRSNPVRLSKNFAPLAEETPPILSKSVVGRP